MIFSHLSKEQLIAHIQTYNIWLSNKDLKNRDNVEEFRVQCIREYNNRR